MAKLLCILVALALTAVIQAGPIPDEIKEIAPGLRETCMAETGVDPDLIERTGRGEFIEDKKLACYAKCIFDQFRLLSDDGINFDALLTLTPARLKESAAHIIKECRDTTWTKGDLCELASKFGHCAMRTEPDKYFVI